MINSYSLATQEVLTNEVLNFTTTSVSAGTTVLHTPNSPSFTLEKPGFYFVSFNGVASVEGATPGAITLQLKNQESDVAGATSTYYSTATTDFGSFSFSTIIQVAPSCCAVNNAAVLTIENIGVGATFTNANLLITKLC